MPKGELASRLTVAAIGIPVAVLIIYWGGWYLGAMMAVVSGLSAGEYYSMAGPEGIRATALGRGSSRDAAARLRHGASDLS